MNRARARKRNTDIEFGRGLLINGRWVKGSQTQVALLARLHKDLGRVVSYKTLCAIAGHPVARERERHIVRQHMFWIKRTLSEHKAPFAVAVAAEVGYALCELAPNRSGNRRIVRA